MNLMAVFTLSYCFLLAPRIGWGGFSKRVWKNWHDNWTLGLAGTAMVASEWWSWGQLTTPAWLFTSDRLRIEIVGLASSALGPARLAAQSVLLTTCSFTYQFSFSMSAAASVRVGNLLGAGSVFSLSDRNMRLIFDRTGSCTGVLKGSAMGRHRCWPNQQLHHAR